MKALLLSVLLILAAFCQSYSQDYLFSWGDNNCGQLGIGANTWRIQEVKSQYQFVEISAGSIFKFGIKNDGSLWAWGRLLPDIFGNSVSNFIIYPFKIGNDNDWAHVSCGVSHVIAIKKDGSIWGWGNNTQSQLGISSCESSSVPIKISDENNWKSIYCCDYYNVAIKNDGSMWNWGSNALIFLKPISKPEKIGSDNKWIKISKGKNIFALKDDGSMWDLINRDNEGSITRIGNDNDWIDVACGKFNLGIKLDGSLWAWGDNIIIPNRIDTTFDYALPTKISADNDWKSIFIDNTTVYGIKNDSTLWSWGDNKYGASGTNYSSRKEKIHQINIDSKIINVFCGNGSAHVLNNGSLIYAFGSNIWGFLGVGQEFCYNSPNLVGDEPKWKLVKGGLNFTVAIDESGSAWMWGDNSLGVIGDSTYISCSHPKKNLLVNDVSSVAVGYNHWIMNSSIHKLWGCGEKSEILGAGNGNYPNYPSTINSDIHFIKIASSNTHSLAIHEDGTLWAWGSNFYYQLGNGNNSNINNPQMVSGDNNWLEIACGNNFSLAIKNDGTLWSWGKGAIADTNQDVKIIPSQINNETDWEKLFVFSDAVIALKNDGTMWAWGNNKGSKLAMPLDINPKMPIRIGNNNDWKEVAIGADHSIGLKTDGSLWAWGDNSRGQLGISTPIMSLNPIRISNDNDWVSVGAGGYCSYALKKTKYNSISEFKAGKVEIFPNICSDFINIKSDEIIENPNIRLYDLGGALIYESFETSNNSFKINTKEFVAGYYILLILSENNKVFQGDFIKK